MPFRKQQSSQDLDEIERKKAELQAQIHEIESFIKEAPEKLQREREERLQTLPAPDELQHIQRENEFLDRLTKGELKNERRHQARSAMLFLFLLAAIIFVSCWVYRVIQGTS